jgi:hypothetical protein
VRDLVVHPATGVTLDLAAEDYGHPDGRAIVASLQGNCRRGVLLCETHGSPVYLQRRATRVDTSERRLWAVHFDGGNRCAPERTGMTDAHKRQTDYIVRAAEEAGFRTATEVRLVGGTTRPDAVVYGPSDVAIEVQRAHLTRAAAVDRTKRTIAAGVATSLWFSEYRETRPQWFFRVPSIGMNKLPWDETTPPRRAATATTGVRTVRAERCEVGARVRCPNPPPKRRTCGQWHPIHLPYTGLTVDEVAAMAPVGDLVPMRFRGADVILVSPRSVALYCDLTGTTTPEPIFHPRAETRDREGGTRAECRADVPVVAFDHCGRCGARVDSPRSRQLGLCRMHWPEEALPDLDDDPEVDW